MKRFALADCNNFFVSCERIFDPKLLGKAVVVLSSNDACVIARSNEAKKLGIKMGEPAFKCKEIFNRYNVEVYSSNFTLYGDISSRVMQTLEEYSTDIEIYSVDEAFMFFPGYSQLIDVSQDYYDYYAQYARFVRTKVKQKVGIPISIGIGPTKTLAKIANRVAKKRQDGVFDITDNPDSDNILKATDVSDIWGIGYQYTKKLKSININNAFEFKNADQRFIRKNFTINGLRTLLELRGISCISLQDEPEPKKSITVSRMFGKNITEITELKEALATYIITAAEKLRNQNMICSRIILFFSYVNYHDSYRFYKFSDYDLPIATSYTPDLIKAANICLDKIFIKNVSYKKIGIILDNFISAENIQLSTFYSLPNNFIKNIKVIKAIDSINNKLGKNKVFFAAANSPERRWKNKAEKKSQAYTTSWHELLTIRI